MLERGECGGEKRGEGGMALENTFQKRKETQTNRRTFSKKEKSRVRSLGDKGERAGMGRLTEAARGDGEGEEVVGGIRLEVFIVAIIVFFF